MTPSDFLTFTIEPCLRWLGGRYDSREARVLMIAIAAQESRITYRRQLGGGPARSYFQIEPQTCKAVIAKWPPAIPALRQLNIEPFQTTAKTQNWLEFNDFGACLIARGILAMDPLRLPEIGDEDGAWEYYCVRTWRPGKPHRHTWGGCYEQARAVVG